jgi:hypothetical protein
LLGFLGKGLLCARGSLQGNRLGFEVIAEIIFAVVVSLIIIDIIEKGGKS